MKKAISTAAVLVMTLFAGFAHADSDNASSEEFYQVIENYKKFCQDQCRAPFRNDPAFDSAAPGQSHLNEKSKVALSEAAFDQAQVWGDTILEGDYYADGKTQLDQVFSIYEGKELVGYRITYSERAWYVGDCQFNQEDESSLSECTEGRIQESSFVSADFGTVFRDENDFAEFRD